MKIYILFAGITASTLLSSPSLSDEITYGIGAAVNDSLKIYFPINTDNFLIEPSIVYFDNNNDTDSPQSFNTEDKTTQIGVGVFVKSSPVKNTFIYYGARVGYIKNEANSDFSGSQISKSKDDGYFIAPTIGAEYHVIDSFSVGLDLSFNYSKTDGSTNTSFNDFDSKFDTKNTTTRSAAEVIVRYYF